MIRIFLEEREKLEAWYKGEMTQKLLDRPVTLHGGTDSFVQRMKDLKRGEIEDILVLPLEKLRKKYSWIEEYVRLCDFCSGYSEFLVESRNGGRLREKRRDYFQKYKGEYLSEGLKRCGMSQEEAVKSWEKTGQVKQCAAKLLEELNRAAREKFDYPMLDETGIRGELVRRMDIPVCPYCNKQYIQAFPVGKNIRYLGDLDHIRPKSVYQLFSLSLWNLVPSCKSCNQLFKRGQTIPILDPYSQGFDEDCILTVDYQELKELTGGRELKVNRIRWEVQPGVEEGKRKLLQHNLSLFCLNESYMGQEREISLTLKRKRKEESKGYRKSLGRMEGITPDPLLLYGVSLDPKRFQHELLSKAIYDIVNHN